MTRTLFISLLVVPIFVACSSPEQQRFSTGYRIGSEVYQSGAAAEAALMEVKPKQVAGTPPDRKVRLLRAPMPSMPKKAIDAGSTDLVVVDIVFNEAGDVESVVPESYSDPILLEAVLAVVRDWKVEPPVDAGKQVKTRVRQPFRFEVQ